jgi:hypothetical protein
LAVFGYQWVGGLPFAVLADWQALIAVVVLSFVYVLGILFDRLADRVFQRWDRSIAAKIYPNAPHTFGVMRYLVSKENEYLHHQFEYTRSRLRIARASALNFALTTLLAEVFLVRWLRGEAAFPLLAAFVGVVGVLLTALAVYTWHKLVRTYFGVIGANYRLQMEKEEPRLEAPVKDGEQRKEPARKKK